MLHARKLFKVLSIALLFVMLSLSISCKANSVEDVRAMSNVDYGETLDEFLANVVDAETEVVAVCDAGDNIIVQYTLNFSHTTALPLEIEEWLRTQENLTTIHNHPGKDVPFSDADLRITIDGCPYKRAIVRTSRTIYYLEVGENGWPTSDQINLWMFNLLSPMTEQEAFGQGYMQLAEDGVNLCTTVRFVEAFAEEFGLKFWYERP